MREATFCLTPAGDNWASARFYTAIAAGCLPGVVADPLTGAFPQQAMYERFWVKVPHEAFIKEPASLLRMLRAMPAAEVAARQRAMAAHRADVLYDLRDSRAGDHFLAEVAEHCLPNLLPELAAENGWNRTALPAAPRLPASCGRAAAIAKKLAIATS